MKLLVFFLILILIRDVEFKKIKSKGTTRGSKPLLGTTSVRSIRRFPFVGALLRKEGKKLSFECGAAIIAKCWAVTAANCFKDLTNRPKYYLRCGSTKWSGVVRRAVDKWRIHEKYKPKTKDYDVALVHVKEEFLQGSLIKVAPSNYKYVGNSKARIVGWGKNKKKRTKNLSTATVRLQDQNKCKNHLQKKFGIKSKTIFCVGNKPNHPYGFDIGGPIFQRKGRKRILIGVAASNPKVSTRLEHLGLYTNLALVSTWIRNNIKTDKHPDRIIGGEPVKHISDYPFVAAVVKGSGPGASFECGSTIIATQWVLTAGHCFLWAEEHETYNVRCCNTRWPDGSDNLVTQQHIHELYTKKSRSDYDVAVLKVSRSFAQQNIVMLAPSNYHYATHSNATVLGWGVRVLYPAHPSQELYYVVVKIQDPQECKEHYAQIRLNMTSRMFCAGDMNKDACRFDSGGPIMQYNEKYKKNVVIGVVSGGLGACGSTIYAGLYVHLASFHKWIEDRIHIGNKRKVFKKNLV